MSSISSLDAVWADMKDDEMKDRSEAKKRSQVLRGGSMVSVTSIMKESGAVPTSSTRKLKSNKISRTEEVIKSLGLMANSNTSDTSDRCINNSSIAVKTTHMKSSASIDQDQSLAVTSAVVISNVIRDSVAVDTGNSAERKKALARIYQTLSTVTCMTEDDFADLFKDIAKSIFKRFADDAEKCRELAYRISGLLFDKTPNVLSVFAYFLPALMQRVPATGAYDDELKIFVSDIDAHEAFKRGRAVDRQDKGESLLTLQVVEPAEEIRLLAVQCLSSLINKACSNGICSVLQPYFTEIIIFLESQLRDPFGDVRLVVCNLLCVLAVQPEFELGMKYYSVALVRAVMPVMRHKHAKLRCGAIDAIRCCVMVRDREKRKGAGTAAIQDLVGFHEDNILPVAAFYKSEVSVNFLAEVVCDPVAAVRERVAVMLCAFLTELEDRYDHQTRLLPYLLDLLTDDADGVSGIALKCLELCGNQYESEHADEIVERRQYGVDGDNRINLNKPLPPPFTGRPRIGMRLYVRGNTKRFLVALLNELTNWISKTRVKSSKLLKIIIVMCEEHLSMDAYEILPAFVKAIGFSNSDKDLDLKTHLIDAIELCGRYLSPDVYVHFILPRLVGDPSVVQFATDAACRIAVMEVLQALIAGTKSSQLPQYFPDLVAALVDPFVIDPDSLSLRSVSLDVILTLLQSLVGSNSSAVTVAVEAHFMTTGRLSSLQSTIRSLFRRLVVDLSEPALNGRSTAALYLLSSIEGRSSNVKQLKDVDADIKLKQFQHLFGQHACPVLQSALLDSFEMFLSSKLSGDEFVGLNRCADWSSTDKSTILLVCRLLECPWCVIQRSPAVLSQLLQHISDAVVGAVAAGRGASDTRILALLMETALAALWPIAYALGESNSNMPTNDIFSNLNVSSSYKAMLDGCTVTRYVPKISEFSDSLATLSTSVDKSGRSLLKQILDSFVCNSVWTSGSVDLQRRRLMLVTTLLGGFGDSFSYTSPYVHSVPSVEFPTLAGSGTSHVTLYELNVDETMERAQCTILGGSVSVSETMRDQFRCQTLAAIISSVCSSALLPGVPLDLRLRALQITEIALNIAVPADRRRLIPFKKRMDLALSGINRNFSVDYLLSLLPSAVDPFVSSPLPSSVVHPGQVIIPMLLSALDDSSDEIRCSAVKVFLVANIFLVNADPCIDGVVGEHSDKCSFKSVSLALLKHLCLAIERDYNLDGVGNFSELLDTLLRSVACLDTEGFETIVRSHLEFLNKDSSFKSSKRYDDIVSTLSGLIQHCDIVTQFTCK